MNAKPNKIFGPGICDVCGEDQEWLQCVDAPPAVGLAICRDCFEHTPIPPEVAAQRARAAAWAVHDYEHTQQIVVKVDGIKGEVRRMTLAQIRDVNTMLTGEPSLTIRFTLGSWTTLGK